MILPCRPFCSPGHRHDPLCDPALEVPRPPASGDPVARGHRAHMEARNQAGWVAWQTTRPLALDEPSPQTPSRVAKVPVKRKGKR